MTTISDKKFNSFLNDKLDLSSHVLTTSLGTISRYNIFSRIAHRKELDSRIICQNIETAFAGKLGKIEIQQAQKNRAIENLRLMQKKFSKSTVIGKQKDCSDTIERIISKLKLPETSPKKNVNTKPKQQTQNSTQKTLPLQNQTSVPQQPAIHSKRNPIDPNGAQKKLVDAISRSTTKTETVTESSIKFVPNMKVIDELEKDATAEDRRLYGFKRTLIYSHFNKQYYFNAFVPKVENGLRTWSQTLVRATEIEEQVKRVRESGFMDIGALLRERMKEMNIEYKEQK